MRFTSFAALCGSAFVVASSSIAMCDTGPATLAKPIVAGFTDTVRHKSGYVTVNGVRLNYLDFGGKGDVIVMLPGLTDTAYIYDDLAPRFIDTYHVYALTRRGCGDSDLNVTDLSNETRVGDILGFLNQMKISKATLIGHSLAGDELTVFAAEHPDRVEKLVYLEAAYDRSGGPFAAFAKVTPEQAAAFTATPPAFLASIDAYRSYWKQFAAGAWNNASEANMWDRINMNKDGSISEKSSPMTGAKLLIASATLHPDESTVKAPALCLFATFDTSKLGGPPAQGVAAMAWQKQQEDIATDKMHAKVITYPAGTSHYLFIQYPDRCAGEIKDFLTSK